MGQPTRLVERDLDQARDLRNWLAHRYFQDRAVQLGWRRQWTPVPPELPYRRTERSRAHFVTHTIPFDWANRPSV